MIKNINQFDSKGQLKHLITLSGISKAQIEQIFSLADSFMRDQSYQKPSQDNLKQKTIANLFFESSTRTRCSFELAARRLSAEVLNLDLNVSSTAKGETLIDTIHTLESMHIDAFVVRHKDDDACHLIAENLLSKARLINAGTGVMDHPTQGLLDLYTIRQTYKDLSKLAVGIIGDVAHSRVARSAIQGLSIMGVPDIRVIAPDSFIADDLRQMPISIVNDTKTGLQGLDVVMVLRIQRERMLQHEVPSEKEYFQQFGLDAKKLKIAKPDAIVLHPGPINRGVEIASEIADGPQSKILLQVTHGVVIRMAVMALLMR